MGLELAEQRLLTAMRASSTAMTLDVRVVGGRSARRHARRIGARWIPARPRSMPWWATTGADLVHLVGLELPPPRRAPFVVTIHDLAPLRFPDEGALPAWARESVQRAALVLTPSRFTAGEVRELLEVPESRIRVIGGAPALDIRDDVAPLTNDELTQLRIQPPFVLRIGGYTQRKAVPLLLDAWSRVKHGTLVLSGPAQPARRAVLASAPSLDRVVVLDYVPAELLARLMRSASVLVSTSSYEGFGLPPLEAIAAGTPVVAVAEPFVEETCGEAALLVQRRAGDLAVAIERLLFDAELRSQLGRDGSLRVAEQRWAAVAGRVLAAYREVHERSSA